MTRFEDDRQVAGSSVNEQNVSGVEAASTIPDLCVGTERYFYPGYRTHLINKRIPSLTGIEEKLKAAARRLM
jgi:hypothetical protein